MKEAYFTEDNIDSVSSAMLERVQKLNSYQRMEFEPTKSALFIVDMQNFFCLKSSHAYIDSVRAIIPRIKKIECYYNELNLPVIFTKHVNTDDDANLMGKWWHELIDEKSRMSNIIEEFQCQNATVIKKSQYDAFYKTELEDILIDKGVSQIVITGVMTHLCCETTARSAFMRGFNVYFTVDGTATYNVDFHNATLINLSHGFAVPVISENLFHQLGS